HDVAAIRRHTIDRSPMGDGFDLRTAEGRARNDVVTKILAASSRDVFEREDPNTRVMTVQKIRRGLGMSDYYTHRVLAAEQTRRWEEKVEAAWQTFKKGVSSGWSVVGSVTETDEEGRTRTRSADIGPKLVNDRDAWIAWEQGRNNHMPPNEAWITQL